MNDNNSTSASAQSGADIDKARRTELLDKISALLKKTTANGCTEAEALAAAELASKLMAKYGLSLSELESISSPIDACEADGAPIGNRRAHEVLHVAHSIAHYTDTRCWYQSHGVIDQGKDNRRLHQHRGVILVFFGLPADVQVAIYLSNVLRAAMDTEWKRYWEQARKDSWINPRTARANFMRGMAHRLSERLREMKKAQSATNDCQTLVLAKDRIVKSAFEASGIKIRKVSVSGGLADPDSYAAGSLAGDRVTIARGALEKSRA